MLITRNMIGVSENDVVCDLPFPLQCALWFDHHPGNLEDLKLRGYNPADVRGRFDLKESCSRVIFEYFSPRIALPPYFEETVREADVIDAFQYRDLEDWKKETPGKIIDCTLKMTGTSRDGDSFRRRLVFLLRDNPLEAVSSRPDIQERYLAYKANEQRMMATIQEASFFLPEDRDREIIVLDMTRYRRHPSVLRNLAFFLYPRSKAVIEVRSLYDRGVKTNDFGVSFSLSPNTGCTITNRDLGQMMRNLNIGDGHRGAAGGTVGCQSKDEMIRKKGDLLKKLFLLWKTPGA
jgi:oligoribonuclease NrnB/cAMP/cGMP phosphodiesterase (DHH superfamily)